MLGKVTKKIGIFIATGLFFLLCYRIFVAWGQIKGSIEFVRWNYLVTSIIALGISYALGFFSWKFLLSKLGVHLKLITASAIVSVSQLGKYIPGKVWYALGRLYITKQMNLPSTKITLSIILEGGFLFLSGFLIASITLFSAKPESPIFILIPIALAVSFFMHPAIINFLLRKAERLIKRKLEPVTLSTLDLIEVLTSYCVMWIVHSLGFYLLCLTIVTNHQFNPLPVMSSFITAWLVGFASIIVPGGLGIREGTLSFLLINIFPPPMNYVLAILGRIWTTVGEAVLFLIFFPLFRKLIERK